MIQVANDSYQLYNSQIRLQYQSNAIHLVHFINFSVKWLAYLIAVLSQLRERDALENENRR